MSTHTSLPRKKRSVFSVVFLTLAAVLGLTIVPFSSVSRASAAPTDGVRDTTFNQQVSGVGPGTNGVVRQTAVQSDGKIIVVGDFVAYGNVPAGRIVRLNTDGSLDTTFNPGGIGADARILAVRIQPDGKILIGGDFSSYNGTSAMRIARLTTTGAIDTTFSSGSGFGGGGSVFTIDMNSTGTIFLGGNFNTYNGVSKNYLAAVSPTGALLTGLIPAAPNGPVNAIFVDPTTAVSGVKDTVLVGGSFSAIGTNNLAGSFARLDPTGTFVPANSAANGTPVGGWVNSIMADSTGRILVAGSFATWKTGTAAAVTVNNVARLTAVAGGLGVLDTSFASTGTDGEVLDVSTDSSNNVLLGGKFANAGGSANQSKARLTSAGVSDPTFSSPNADGWVYSTMITASGGVLFGGNFQWYGGLSRGGLIFCTSAGAPDSSAVANLPFSAPGNISDTAFQTDGKTIIVGTFSLFNGNILPQKNIVRLTQLLAVDTTFNASGVGPNQNVTQVEIDPNTQKIYIAGQFWTYNGTNANGLARLNTDGTLDTTFFSNGANIGVINAMTLNSAGEIFVGGTLSQYNSTTVGKIAAILPTGQLDTTFMTNVNGGANGPVTKIAIDSSGRLVVVGSFTTFNGATYSRNIVRLLSTGVTDTSFTFGSSATSGITTGTVINSVAIDPNDQSVVIAGDFTSYVTGGTTYAVGGVAKLSSTGANVAAFNGTTGAERPVVSVAIDSSSRIYIGGTFTTWKGAAARSFARLTVAGALDTTFVLGGISSWVYSGATVQSIAIRKTDGAIVVGGPCIKSTTTTTSMPFLDSTGAFWTSGTTGGIREVRTQTNGQIVIGGLFTSFNGVAAGRVTRLNTDGTVDTAFAANAGTGANSDVYSVAIQPNGQILAIGAFTSWNGVAANGIVRLNADGTMDTSFSANVAGGPNAVVQSVGVQTNGQIVVGGAFTSWNGTTVGYAVRLNADGTRDTAFSANVGTAANGNNIVYAVAIQTNGQIILGGAFWTWNSNAVGYIVRLNTDGTWDRAFSGQAQAGSWVTALAVQSDGKILAGGHFTTWTITTAVNRLVRLNSDGSKDTAFITNLGTAASDYLWEIVVQTDGKILLGGQFTSWNGVAANSSVRLNADGTQDTTFATNVGTGSNSLVWSFAVQSNGNVLMGGYFTTWNGVRANSIVRLTNTLPNFNAGGTGPNDAIRVVKTQTNGQIVIGGLFTSFNGVSAGRVIRLNSDAATVDTAFNTNTGTGANGEVDTIAVQPNGQILVGGSFTAWNGVTANRIVRLNADGTLDTAFMANAGSASNNNVNSIAVQADGRILVAGFLVTWNGASANAVVRLNTDGTRDTSFSANAGSGANNAAFTVSVQTNAQIVIGGAFTSWNGTAVNRVVRLNSDGTRDTAFTTNIGSASSDLIFMSALQPDGKLLLSGYFLTWNGTTVNRVVRLNTDGTQDTAFTANTGTAAGTAVGIVPYAIAVQPDGKILLGGQLTTWNGVAANYFVRLNADGTMDTMFTTNNGTPNNMVFSIAVQTNGSILAGGYFTLWNGSNANRLVLLPNTLPDYTVGGTAANNVIRTVKTQADGKILIGGYFTSFNGVSTGGFARLNYDTSIDTAFAANIGTGANNQVFTIAVQPNGQILVGGLFTSWNGTPANGLVRLNADGTLDTAFMTNIGSGANSYVLAMALQSNGQILVGGNFTTWNGTAANSVVRLNADGTRDTSFTTNIGTGPNSGLWSIAVQPNGQILLGGNFTTWNGASAGYLVRLNANGTQDTAFTATTGYGAGNTVLMGLALQPDGKILATGRFTTYSGTTVNRIVRLNSNGSIDTAFTANTGTAASDEVDTVAVQADGKILVGGNFLTWNGNTVNRIVRLNSDGTQDTAFTTTTGYGANDYVLSIAVQADGKILVAGSFTTWNGSSANRLVRLSNGVTGFNLGGAGADNNVAATAVDSSGNVLLGGYFANYNGVSSNYLLRTNPSGVKDMTFNYGGSGPNGSVSAIAIQSDGKILIGGAFTTYNGISAPGIVRLLPTGAIDPTWTGVTTGVGSTGQEVDTIVVQPLSGAILIGGNFTSFNGSQVNYFVRLNGSAITVGSTTYPAGSIDNTFGTGGSTNGPVSSIALKSDGVNVSNDLIYLGGQFTSYAGVSVGRVVRVLNTGAIDSTYTGVIGTWVNQQVYNFNLNAWVADPSMKATPGSNAAGADDSVSSIALQSNGSLIIGGPFTNYYANGSKTAAPHIARLTTTGTLDTSFNPGTGANDSVYAVAVASNGNILLAGAFTQYAGVARGYVARVTPGGALDPTFAASAGANGYVSSLKIQPLDGYILVSGRFTTFNGAPTGYVNRLSP